MEKQSNSVISKIVELFGRKQYIPEVPFSKNEIVISPKNPLSIRWYGAYLNVPNGVVVVLTSPDGETKAFDQGGVLNLKSGNYKLNYVDMRQRSIYLKEIVAKSNDGWDVSLAVEITWFVIDPLRVLKIDSPIISMEKHCQAAVRNHIQSRPHNDFAASPEGVSVEEETICSGILDRLHNNPALGAYRFIGVNLLRRAGDQELTTSIQDAMKEKAKTERTLEVEMEKLRADLEITKKKIELAKEQKILATEESEVSQQDAIISAKYQARVFDILREAEIQKTKIAQLGKSQELEQEQKIEIIRATQNILSDLAAALSQAQMTPGIQNPLDNTQIQSITDTLRSLSSFVAADSTDEDDLSSDSPDILPVIDIN